MAPIKKFGIYYCGYKAAVTTKIRKTHADFGWQARFHDHIIRDNENYQRISHYIAQNPQLWKKDKFYVKP